MNLRIGLVTYGLDRPPTGVGRHTIELIRAIQAQPVDVTLLTTGRPGYLPGVDRFTRTQLTSDGRLPVVLTLGSIFLPRKATSLDLVHDPTGNPPFLFGAGSAKRIVTVHDVFALSFPGSSTLAEQFVTKIWLRLILPHVEAVITDSLASKRDLIRFYGLAGEKIHVIPCGVGAEFRRLEPARVDAVLARYGLERGYLLSVGSLNPRRNLPRLLDAYAQLDSPPPLALVGRAAPAEQARLAGNRGQVRWTGYVPDADLPALYNGAGAFIFPSLYEGFGLTPLEAMACGTPVACSTASSLPEVTGDATLRFDPYRVDEIADCMRRLLISPELRADLRQRGLARAATFTWSRTAQMTVDVYRQVLGTSGV